MGKWKCMGCGKRMNEQELRETGHVISIQKGGSSHEEIMCPITQRKYGIPFQARRK